MTNNFSLIETILWENGDYFLLRSHLKRIKNSARHFSFAFNDDLFNKTLSNLSCDFINDEKYKVRLLLNNKGAIKISYDELEPISENPLMISFSKKRTDKNDIFYYHKTTNRVLYNTELERIREKGFFDIIFTNQEDQITEGSITNIVIKKNNEYFTPPLSCGVLNGIFRQHLFAQNSLPLKEKILYKEDLLSAEEIYLLNSVRKMVTVTL